MRGGTLSPDIEREDLRRNPPGDTLPAIQGKSSESFSHGWLPPGYQDASISRQNGSRRLLARPNARQGIRGFRALINDSLALIVSKQSVPIWVPSGSPVWVTHARTQAHPSPIHCYLVPSTNRTCSTFNPPVENMTWSICTRPSFLEDNRE